MSDANNTSSSGGNENLTNSMMEFNNLHQPAQVPHHQTQPHHPHQPHHPPHQQSHQLHQPHQHPHNAIHHNSPAGSHNHVHHDSNMLHQERPSLGQPPLVQVPHSKHNPHHKSFFLSGRLKQLLMQRQGSQKIANTSHSQILQQSEVVVDVYYYSPARLERKSTSNVDELFADPPEWATVAWVNVDGINEPVLKKLALEFDLHPIAVEDVVEIQHRPKLDFFGDVLFMITSIVSKSPMENGKVTIVTEQVSFFLVGKTLISIQQGIPGDVWESVRTSILDQDSITRNSDAGFLLYALLAGIVDTCKPIIDELEDTLEDLEVAMMEYPSHRLNKMVYAVKRHQITLRSILFPTRKLLQRMLPEEANNTEFETPNQFTSTRHNGKLPTRFEGLHAFSSITTTYFRDLFGVITHLCEQIEQQKEISASLTSLHLNHQAQRQGTASYAIAIVSVFFLPLTFIAGVYGMNFSHMPELNWELGYLYVWIIFIGVVLFEVFIFHSVGWIEFKMSKRISHMLGLKRKAGTLPPKYYRVNSLITAESDSAMSEM